MQPHRATTEIVIASKPAFVIPKSRKRIVLAADAACVFVSTLHSSESLADKEEVNIAELAFFRHGV
jgi:hypothetical protein